MSQFLSHLDSSSSNGDPRFYKQRSDKWFHARKGKRNESKAATALEWYGKIKSLA